MSKNSVPNPKSDIEAKPSDQAESFKPMTMDEVRAWIDGLKDGRPRCDIDGTPYLRLCGELGDEEQDDEEDDDDGFDWVKYTKEARERRAAKDAQSSVQKKTVR